MNYGHSSYMNDIPAYLEKRYNIQRQLGYGSYGTVFLAIQKSTKKQVAIKYMHHIFNSREDATRTLREISIMRQCNHPCICKVLDAFIPQGKDKFNCVWLVMEYGGWDLQKVMETYRDIQGWSASHVRYIMYQIVCAFHYLRTAYIMHRDVKPSNILMDTQCGIHVIDFGLARRISPTQPVARSDSATISVLSAQSDDLGALQVDQTAESSEPPPLLQRPVLQRQLTRHIATRWYRAPEIIILEKNYSFSVDIWSLGCIFAELLQTLEPDIGTPSALFPGTACYPLSRPRTGEGLEILKEEYAGRNHQLLKIFEIIGTPTPEEIDALENEDMKAFLHQIDPIKGKGFKELLPHAEPAALDLLSRMLLFDPEKRITPEEALESPYFNGVRCKDMEMPFGGQLVLPIDFSKIDTEMTVRLCRTQIYNEILQFTEKREKEEEEISLVRRLSSSSKVLKMVTTKAQLKKPEEDKKCTVMWIVCLTNHESLYKRITIMDTITHFPNHGILKNLTNQPFLLWPSS